MYRMDNDEICDPGISHVFPAGWYAHPPPPYPNPTSGHLYLDGRVRGEVSLYDQAGRSLMTWHATGELPVLDLSPLSPGMYFLTLRMDDGRPMTHKIVKL